MKLEQTIQGASKHSGGIIGDQTKEVYVAEKLFETLLALKLKTAEIPMSITPLIGTSRFSIKWLSGSW